MEQETEFFSEQVQHTEGDSTELGELKEPQQDFLTHRKKRAILGVGRMIQLPTSLKA